MTNALEELGVMKLYAKLPNSGGEVEVLVDDDYDGEYFSQYTWSISKAGYVWTTSLNSKRASDIKQPHAYLHHLVLPPKEGYWRQFKNGNRLDCRSCNVIYRTSKESALARPLGGGMKGKLGWVGVYGYTNRNGGLVIEGRYRAKYNARYLGVYSTPEEAARARDKYVIESGVNSRLNFPDEIEKTKITELHPVKLGYTYDHQKRTKPLKSTPRPPIGEDYLWAARKGEVFKVLMDPEDVIRLKDRYFFIKKDGVVAYNTVTKEGKRNTLGLNKLILPDELPMTNIRHINGDKLDFRKENLTTSRSVRVRSPKTGAGRKTQARMNQVNPESGYIGVKFQRSGGRANHHVFSAYVGGLYLGRFFRAEDAAKARDKWVKKWRPELELNFKEED